MKTFKYLMAAVIGLSTVSCYNLDITPVNVLGESVLLNSDYGIRKYFAITYHDLPIEDFNYYVNRGYTITNDSGNRWEALKGPVSAPSGHSEGFNNANNYEDFGYWDFNGITGGAQGKNGPYYRIREINNFLQQMPLYESYHSAESYNGYIAEAHFLRAYYYWALVRRYGGVVIMTETLDPMADPETLQLPRSKEYDCWKFIYEDLKFAMENGPATSVSGRFNRYAAAALMSRAMLYAGSVAKYGNTYTLTGPAVDQGLQKMPRETAAEFYQYVLDACQFIQDGGYTLHTGGDKEQAYVEVFTTPTAEDIFVKNYTWIQDTPYYNAYLAHSWDGMALPQGEAGLATAPGSTFNPTWNIISMFQMPAVAVPNADGELVPVRFDSREAFWQSPEMEPRMRANFFFSGMVEPASGVTFNIQRGVFTNYTRDDGTPGTVEDGAPESGRNEFTGLEGNTGRRKTSDDRAAKVDGITITGNHGSREGAEQRTNTGVILRKYISTTSTSRGLAQSTTAFKVFRYGEILLNRAEAAYELGLETGNNALKNEAFTYIAQIRERAGARPYEMKSSPIDVGMLEITEPGGKGYGFSVDENLQFIRDERTRELCFENQHIFDLIRWRVAHRDLDGNRVKHFEPYLILSENKWIFLPEYGRTMGFSSTRYYNSVPGGVRDKNPKVIQNAGY